MINRVIRYFLENRIITAFLLVAVILGGLATAPFDWHGGLLPRDPISVDAIPDIGVGSVYSSLSDIYRPHPGLRPPLPLKGGEWLRLPLRQYVDFLKWTQLSE